MVTLTAGGALCEWANVPQMADWTWLIPVYAAFATVAMTGLQVLVRERRYPTLGRIRLAQAGVQSGTQLGAGAAGAGGPGFVAGAVASMAIWALLSLGALRAALAGIRGEAARGARAAVRTWRRFAAWSWFATLVSAGTIALMPILVAALYSPADAGLFVLAQRILNVPAILTGEAIGSAWYGTAAEILRGRGRGLPQALGTITRSIALGSGVLFAAVLLLGPPLFGFVFGESWEGGGDLLLALAPLHFAMFVGIPASQTLHALGRTGTLTATAAARLAAGVGGVTIASALGWSLTAGLGIYAAGTAVTTAVAMLAARRAARRSDEEAS